MTGLLTIDPGVNSGIALGFYNAVTPYQVEERWQVHDGLTGFIHWWEETFHELWVDEIVCESFSLREENKFAPDVTPLRIEGALEALLSRYDDDSGFGPSLTYQPPSAKGGLTGYSPKAQNGTKAMRQRERFDFLDRFGMFRPGTENDDTHDAITHALVFLKRRKHMPTLRAFWSPRAA